MSKDEATTLQECTWIEIREKFSSVNPILAKIIDKISPDDSYTFFVAKYPYGSQILIDGKMFLPGHNGELIPFEDSRICNNIRSKIGYVMGTNPMTMVLKNTLDLFITIENRTIMFSLIEPGQVFGTWQLLDDISKGRMFFTPITLWDMTAGARSIFMLPKITDLTAFSKIQKKYDIKQGPPKVLGQQWGIFKDIANHPEFGQSWETEVLFFSKKWIDSANSDDPAWYEFRDYLTKCAWAASEFWRNQFCWDLTFSRIQAKRNIKPCPFAADIANHLIGMTVGAVPGFNPLVDDSVGPIKQMMKIFETEYGSRYAPIMVGPSNFSIFEPKNNSAFYSFQYHTAIKLSQKSSSRSSTVTDMYNVRALLEKYIDDIKNSELNIEGTILHEVAQKVKFTFYHCTADEYTKMTSPNYMFNENRLFQHALKDCETRSFPKNAPFFNGCVEISDKD